MTYFKDSIKINYPYSGLMVDDLSEPKLLQCIDLFVRYRFSKSVLNSPDAFYEYTWKDTDRPDTVAKQYYGDADLHWIVLLSAGIQDARYDLPLRESAFFDYLSKKYDTQNPLSLDTVVHHYEDEFGTVIDFDTFQNLSASNRKTVSVFDYEFNLNEDKRKVKLISRAYTQQIIREFKDLVKSMRTTQNV